MAKNKREPISLKTRIEVFKRDSFTCQYCGRHAPEVVLEVDHIKPVTKGGTNDIMNLVTSCFECNRGKGKRELKDSSVVDKQHNQLKLMQEKRNQLQMMIEWKEELADILDEQEEYFTHKLWELTGYNFNQNYRRKLKLLIRKIGFSIVFDAFEICKDQYFSDDDETFADNISKNLIGVAYNLYNERHDPKKASLKHIANVLKNNCNHFNPKSFYSGMSDFKYEIKDEKDLINLAYKSYSVGGFLSKVEDFYNVN